MSKDTQLKVQRLLGEEPGVRVTEIPLALLSQVAWREKYFLFLNSDLDDGMIWVQLCGYAVASLEKSFYANYCRLEASNKQQVSLEEIDE